MPTKTAPQSEPVITNGELELSLGGNAFFHTTPTGIILADDLTYEGWMEGLRLFKRLKSEMTVWFSDYLTQGNVKFGQVRANDALAQLEFEMPDVKTALAIGTVPMELRKPGLESGHYIVLARADISKKQKEAWAEKASTLNLSPTTLKSSIENGEVVNPSVARQQTHGVLSIHGIVGEFQVWVKRVGELDGVMKMATEDRDEMMNEMSVIVDFFNSIRATEAKLDGKSK